MCGLRAVTNMSELPRCLRMISMLGWKPRAQRSSKERHPSARSWLEGIQLEISLRACKRRGVVVAEHLHRDLSKTFALRRIDLAGHDRGPRLIGRQGKLADSRPRPAGVPSQVVGDFHQAAG